MSKNTKPRKKSSKTTKPSKKIPHEESKENPHPQMPAIYEPPPPEIRLVIVGNHETTLKVPYNGILLFSNIKSQIFEILKSSPNLTLINQIYHQNREHIGFIAYSHNQEVIGPRVLEGSGELYYDIGSDRISEMTAMCEMKEKADDFENYLILLKEFDLFSIFYPFYLLLLISPLEKENQKRFEEVNKRAEEEKNRAEEEKKRAQEEMSLMKQEILEIRGQLSKLATQRAKILEVLMSD